MMRSVKSSQRMRRLVAAQITVSGGTPSVTMGGTEVSVADTGAGVVTVTFLKPFAKVPAVTVSPVATAGDAIATVDVLPTVSAVVVKTWDGTDGTTAKDNISFCLIAVGDDVSESY